VNITRLDGALQALLVIHDPVTSLEGQDNRTMPPTISRRSGGYTRTDPLPA